MNKIYTKYIFRGEKKTVTDKNYVTKIRKFKFNFKFQIPGIALRHQSKVKVVLRILPYCCLQLLVRRRNKTGYCSLHPNGADCLLLNDQSWAPRRWVPRRLLASCH